MPDQTQITSYLKPAGQSTTSTKSTKCSPFTSCPSSTPQARLPANQVARTSYIAPDETLGLKSFRSNVFTSCPSSTLRSCLPANQPSLTPQILAQALLQALCAVNMAVLWSRELCDSIPITHLDRTPSPIHLTAWLLCLLARLLTSLLACLLVFTNNPFPFIFSRSV